jgi:hypothetical protein
MSLPALITLHGLPILPSCTLQGAFGGADIRAVVHTFDQPIRKDGDIGPPHISTRLTSCSIDLSSGISTHTEPLPLTFEKNKIKS